MHSMNAVVKGEEDQEVHCSEVDQKEAEEWEHSWSNKAMIL